MARPVTHSGHLLSVPIHRAAPQRFVVRARLVTAAKPLPQPGPLVRDARPSPFLAHRQALRAVEEADSTPDADAVTAAPAAPPTASAAETRFPAATPAGHGIGLMNPARLFQKIAQRAHRSKAEVAQAPPPANESGNQ